MDRSRKDPEPTEEIRLGKIRLGILGGGGGGGGALKSNFLSDVGTYVFRNDPFLPVYSVTNKQGHILLSNAGVYSIYTYCSPQAFANKSFLAHAGARK